MVQMGFRTTGYAAMSLKIGPNPLLAIAIIIPLGALAIIGLVYVAHSIDLIDPTSPQEDLFALTFIALVWLFVRRVRSRLAYLRERDIRERMLKERIRKVATPEDVARILEN
jgi:heme exporter protein D